MRDDRGAPTMDEGDRDNALTAGARSFANGEPLMQVDDLCKAFGTRTALSHVSLAFREGEFAALLGRSGAGKTTLFRCIAGLERPDQGSVRFDGLSVPDLASTDRRRIAVVFQDFNLVRRLTAFENVLGGRLGHVAGWRAVLRQFERADMLKAFECLERVGLLDHAHQRADTLSGGQQQRVAVARALAQEPRLIVADEPVASLDPASATTVLQLLADIAHRDGVAVVCSLHQVGYARSHADRIVGMAHGTIVVDKDAGTFGDADSDALYAATPQRTVTPPPIAAPDCPPRPAIQIVQPP